MVEDRTKALIAQEKQSIIGSMVTGIVHNFRTPLTVVLGYSEFLYDYTEGISKEYVDKIIEAAKHLDEMMGNLMIKSTLDHTTQKEDVKS